MTAVVQEDRHERHNRTRGASSGRDIPVTIDVPAGLLAGYDAEVERSVYETRETALLHGLVESHRHHHGRYSTLRVDLWRPDDPRPDTPPDDDGVEDALAAADAMLDAETGEPDAGEPSDEDGQR